MNIIIDDREKAVIPFFEGFDASKYTTHSTITYEVQRVNVGDYSILCGDYIIMNIERKTWKDLASSFKDGRKDNVEKMLKLREDTKSELLPNGCQLMYLIEGPPIPRSTARYCRVPYKNMRSHLDHLMFRHNIHVIHSKNKQGTVARIYELCKNYGSMKTLSKFAKDETKEGGADGAKSVDGVDKAKSTKDTPTKSSSISKLKAKTVVSAKAMTYKIWVCIPHITETTACMFIEKGYHISDLILGNISKDEIYAFKYANGRIIGKRSEKIWKNSRIAERNNRYFVKMLTQIRGITKATGILILNTISWEQLLKNKITCQTIANIKKSDGGRKIGPKAANDICQYFAKK